MLWLHRIIGKAHMQSGEVYKDPKTLCYCMAKHTVNALCGWLPDRHCAVLMVWRGLRAASCQKEAASKGIWAAHSRHSSPPSRDLKQNWFLSPPPISRILSCMSTVAQRCLYFKLVICARHVKSAATLACSCACPQRRREPGTALPVQQEAELCWRAHQHN